MKNYPLNRPCGTGFYIETCLTVIAFESHKFNKMILKSLFCLFHSINNSLVFSNKVIITNNYMLSNTIQFEKNIIVFLILLP